MFPGTRALQLRDGLQLQNLKEEERREYLVGRTQITALSVAISDAVSLDGATRKPAGRVYCRVCVSRVLQELLFQGSESLSPG